MDVLTWRTHFKQLHHLQVYISFFNQNEWPKICFPVTFLPFSSRKCMQFDRYEYHPHANIFSEVQHPQTTGIDIWMLIAMSKNVRLLDFWYFKFITTISAMLAKNANHTPKHLRKLAGKQRLNRSFVCLASVRIRSNI